MEIVDPAGDFKCGDNRGRDFIESMMKNVKLKVQNSKLQFKTNPMISDGSNVMFYAIHICSI